MPGFPLSRLFVTAICIAFPKLIFSQCCAGGSGSPIAGGASQGVLQERQLEFNTNFQFISTDKFYSKSSLAPDSIRSFDKFESQYEYFRLAYGVSKNFTMSVETGYYFKKKETGLNENPLGTYETKGFGDLILFPRYDIINWTEEKTRTEVTLGLGFKIPLGSYNDSTGIKVEPPAFPGQMIYVTKPQAVQLSTGAQDFIFYSFFSRSYTEKNFKLFANFLYIKKGWNPNGEKLGDFTSFGLFANRSLSEHLSLTLQARYEHMQQMRINENTLLFGKPSMYYPEATGSKKVFIVPQLNFSKGKVIFYASTDLPVYQYVNSSDFYTQAGSKFLLTLGLSYRFFVVKSNLLNPVGGTGYCCPMHPEETSGAPGICSKCGMDLELKKKKSDKTGN